MVPFIKMSYPTVYILSQIPQISERVKCVIPKGVPIKAVPLPLEFEKELTLSREQIHFAKDAEIFLADPHLISRYYTQFTKLKWVHSTWAGIDLFLPVLKKSKGLPSFILTRHASDAFSSLMAEHVICQILNWERNMRFIWENQKMKKWIRMERFASFKSIRDLVVCVLGVGSMGCGVAKHLRNWGAKIIGYAKNRREPEAKEFSFFHMISTNIDDLLPKCDYLINTLPGTPETSGFLNGKVLSICEKKPVFINVGRGTIISEQDIIQAINKKWISGAVLDVFENEPLSETSGLWDMPEVIITPHIAAISTVEHVAESFANNFNKYIAGQKLDNIANLSVGY